MNTTLLTRTTIVFAAVLLCVSLASAQLEERTAIAFARNINAAALDSTLPKVPFCKWLAWVVGDDAIIRWEFNDCGEQTGNPVTDGNRDIPLCAQARVTFNDGRTLHVSLFIGTRDRGVVRSPAVYDITLTTGRDVRSIRRLADLESILQVPVRASRGS